MKTLTLAEVDARLSRVSDRSSPHVVVVGRKIGKEWRYVISDPMTYAAADETIEIFEKMRLSRDLSDNVMFVRQLAHPSGDYRRTK